MLLITNISVASVASKVLRQQRAKFRPRQPGDVLALLYTSSFTNPDGTTVAGFRPGYMVVSHSPVGLADHWVRARLSDGSDFLFMPKFRWVADEHYVVDMASEVFALFSIEPAGRR
jgi:hypothetical protein